MPMHALPAFRTSDEPPTHARSARLAAVALLSLALASPAAAAPTAGEVLDDLGFPSDAPEKVMAGQFVTSDVESTSDSEIALGMAFFVKMPPAKLVDELKGGLLLRVDSDAKARGTIAGGGALSDFQDVSPNPAQRAAYRNAKPGEALNLSSEEIAAFRALAGKPDAQVDEALRRQLLGRLQAYRAGGLDGIAPYERGDGKQTLPAADLRRASKASAGVEKYAPSFYGVLLGYPKSRPAGFEEVYRWVSYEAHGTPVFILTHGFATTALGGYTICQRQFYVSGNYNTEQAIAGFLPVEGGTLVVYVNRTSTDQVEGFGSSGKRSIGRKLMGSQLEDLFAKLQGAATN